MEISMVSATDCPVVVVRVIFYLWCLEENAVS